MENHKKDDMYRESMAHVSSAQQVVQREIERMDESIDRGAKEWRSQSADDRVVLDRFLAHYSERKEELAQLYPSPYFVRCDVVFKGEEKSKTYYFAKFPLSEASIYSWTAPAASMRFESPGRIAYTAEDEEIHEGTLVRKDQYMIVDGKIKFFSFESQNTPRELIYQEHFSTRKEGFVLQEIVAQMEKAQDQVIRAHHKGPFVISGPAGSGKTTLALHRVAYLLQSPDTSALYPADSVIVLVQDVGTRDYFAHLLPDLGIKHVTITTFSDWAMQILELNGYTFGKLEDVTQVLRDEYEYAKIKALRVVSENYQDWTNPYTYLSRVYDTHLNAQQKTLWAQQVQKKQLDRIDLTLLLQARVKSLEGLMHRVETFVRQKNGTYKRKYVMQKVRYNLMIIDEFQNYLPEQLHIFAACQHPHLNSTVYVGDLAQQVQLGTLRRWEDLGQDVTEDRRVNLQKVYRNTKEILTFINSLGYSVTIPKELKSGPPVTEHLSLSPEDDIAYIQQCIATENVGTIGVIAFDPNDLVPFKVAFAKDDQVHCLTMYEAQGVEFDKVFIVGVSSEMFRVDHLDENLRREKQHIYKDLLYVALTRSMRELHILGSSSLVTALNSITGKRI